MSYVPQVDDHVIIENVFQRFAEPVSGVVRYVIQPNEAPDRDRLLKLFERKIRSNGGDPSGIGLSAKPSKHVRFVLGQPGGRSVCVTLHSYIKIRPVRIKPLYKYVGTWTSSDEIPWRYYWMNYVWVRGRRGVMVVKIVRSAELCAAKP